jgi:hypothetical protein
LRWGDVERLNRTILSARHIAHSMTRHGPCYGSIGLRPPDHRPRHPAINPVLTMDAMSAGDVAGAETLEIMGVNDA